MKAKLFLLPLLMLVLFSCNDVVQVELDEGARLYVIDAFINDNGSKQVVKIHYNDKYFGDTEAPPVDGAQVTITDLNDNLDYTFKDAGNGNYVHESADTNTIARTGHQYRLSVKIEGTTYTALTVQKRTAGIYNINYQYNDGKGGGFSRPGPPHYMCFLSAKDKADDNPDFYWIKTFRNDTLFSAPSDINISIDGTNGEIKGLDVDSTYFTEPIIFLGFKTYPPGSTCKVEIHSLTREAYYFFLQAATQINNAGLFATTPENVKTNIVTPTDAKYKAVGWFNMATVSKAGISLPK
jgi:hypothetical protein